MANLLITLLYNAIPMIYLHLLLIGVATIFITHFILFDTGFISPLMNPEFVKQNTNKFCLFLSNKFIS